MGGTRTDTVLYLFVAYRGLLFGVVAVAMTRYVDYNGRKLVLRRRVRAKSDAT